MKKIFFLAAGALLFAACNEDFKDWAEPQSVEPTSPIGEVTLTLSPAFATLDLDQAGETVKLFNAALSEGAKASGYAVTLSNTEGATYGLSADAEGTVSAADLNKAVVTLYDRVRQERDINIEAVANVVANLSSGTVSVPVAAKTSTKIMVQTSAYAEFYYLVGGDTNWNGDAVLQSKECDGKYVGYAHLSQEFKFRPVAGNWDVSLGCTSEGKVGESGGDCPAPAVAGLHKVELDLEAMTYNITCYNGVSIVGDATGDPNWGTDIDMEYSTAEKCYIVTTELVAGSFKFRTDHAWNGVNWGGEDADHLVIDGANCSIAAAGLYIVRFWPSYSGNGRYEVEAQAL